MIKRAEQLAWGAFATLAGIAVVLLVGAIMYRFTGFWAGMMLASGQAVVMALAAWGLGLARQARELNEFSGKTYRASQEEQRIAGLSMGAEEPAGTKVVIEEQPRTLDTGFQRLVVGIAAGILVVLAGIATWGVYAVYAWTQANPEKTLSVAGGLGAKTPTVFDELALLIGLASAVGYGAMWWTTRPSRRVGIYGDASSSNFTIGLTAMAALGVATVLGYFKVTWAGEIAAAVIAGFMLLQGLELIVNACRNYSGIDEFEQDAVDLQATPLVPMLSSVWLGGLRMLLAQSVGLSEGGGHKGEKGVIARMMPRVLLAVAVIAVLVSCIRIVPPGQVAVIERLGYTPTVSGDDPRPLEESVLKPGLHITLPWPIDQLVYLPTQELQLANVGTELHAGGDWKNVDFQFWMVRPPGADQAELNDLFVTGDAGSPQFLETYIEVRWRVADASRFYATMSHSEAFDATATGEEARIKPIYEALVQHATSEAVTEAFAIHSLEQILLTDRQEVEAHCKTILQQRLDMLCSMPGDKPGESHRGIEVAYLTIKDLHPPYWHPDRPDSNAPVIGGMIRDEKSYPWEIVDNPQQTARLARGPASAFELVVAMREFRQTIINRAEAQAVVNKLQAHSEAEMAKADAAAYVTRRVGQARGDADRFVEMTKGMSAADLELLKLRLLLDSTKDAQDPTRSLYDQVTKIVVDPRVTGVQLIQNSDKSTQVPFRPPGQ